MRHIYLNNAATTWPKPQEVPQSVFDFMTRSGANAARGSASERDIKSLDIIFTARARAAKLFGGYAKANPKYVTLTANVTHSLNIVIKGFLKPEMRVVTTSMEHNSVVRPLRELQKQGVLVDVLQCSLRGYLPPKALSEALLEKTDLVVMTHCSNVCGSVQPLEEAAEICARRGVPLVVDCAQTGGLLPVDARELGLAALCFTGHKGLFGPQGTGGIVWNPEFAERCAPLSLCQSRWNITQKLVDLINASDTPPSVLISGSALGAILGAALAALVNTEAVKSAADDMVANIRKLSKKTLPIRL